MNKLHQYWKDSRPVEKLVWLGLMASLVFFAWAIFPYLLPIPPSSAAGQFGDSYGALNTLFSGLAFAFLGFTLWQQREEIRLQKIDVEQNQQLIRGQQEELKKQNETLSQQQFESTFFQMLSLYNQIADSIKTTSYS